jgi:hypothetical protein
VVHSFCGDDPIACRITYGGSSGCLLSGAWKLISEHIYRTEKGEPFLRVRKCLDENGKKQYPQARWDGRTMARDKTLDRALDRLRKSGAALVLTYTRDTVSGRSFTSSRTAFELPTRRHRSCSNILASNPAMRAFSPAARNPGASATGANETR